MVANRPSLAAFERLVMERKSAEALHTAMRILNAIDERYGRLEHVDIGEIPKDAPDEEVAQNLATRFAAAFARLLTQKEFAFAGDDYERLLLNHRWIDVLFAQSGFRTSDHLFNLFATTRDGAQLNFEGPAFLKLLASMSLNSRIHLDFEQFWRANHVAAGLAFLNYISTRYLFSPRAFQLRERLLEWLPGRLDDLKLGSMVLSRMPEIYMHCSYAMSAKKHDIKAPIMRQMRRACLEAGCTEMTEKPVVKKGERPTVVVVAEHLLPGHAVYRTHSLTVKSLREKFHVVGIVYPNPTGTEIESFFDEVVPMPAGDFLAGVRHLATEISARKPSLIYYLGVGMVPQVIALASLRLAPVQCVSFGHTATTMSEAMDYYILPEDFVGAEECFSEKVIGLPKEAIPFTPRPVQDVKVERENDGIVRVAVPASTMKLNPYLFDVIARIGAAAKSKVEFLFFPLAATGLPYFELSRVVRARIPNAKVFSESPHDVYVQRLAACDFFLCPFPYGNMNSIIDAFRLGLAGVCLDGKEAHAHADAAIFARIGLPAELAASTMDDYVNAAVRMIDDADWRRQCRDIVAGSDLDAAFFRGDPSLFCKAIEGLIASGPVK